MGVPSSFETKYFCREDCKTDGRKENKSNAASEIRADTLSGFHNRIFVSSFFNLTTVPIFFYLLLNETGFNVVKVW